MAYITRELERKFLKLNDFFKVILVTGARQVGKTTMLKHLAESSRTYVTMDNTMARALAQSDPVLFPISASAAEMTEAKVPVTLTVVNTVSPISCTVPAALPVSLVDGYVVCANNAAITNTGKTGAIRVTKVDVQPGSFEIGNYDDFSANKNSIALNINGCSTKGAGSLTLVDGSFPAIAAEKNLAIRYKAKVSANEAVTNVNAAIVIFTIAAVTDKEAA